MLIRAAVFPADGARVRALFEEYAAALAIDLSFQHFGEELAGLPGDYAPPAGMVLLADSDGVPLGCVALRPFAPPAVAELKRLYVRPAGRGHGLGRRLAAVALDQAAALGYARVRLDTLADMAAAQRLYESLGFRDIAAYRYNPQPGVRYMECALPNLPETGGAAAGPCGDAAADGGGSGRRE